MKRVIYCTIASANYLPRVFALKESIERNRRGADVRILLCEHPRVVRELEEELKQEFYAPDEIGCPQWRQMAFYYDCMEFNTAVKPFFLKTLMDEGADAVVYFDPDIVVFGGLEELESSLETHDAILTPHLCEPMEDDGHTPALIDFNRVGQFNLGFIGFARNERSERSLRWWANRCERDCISDLSQGLFTDQAWANLFASFLEVKILRSQAYNMAYWNLSQRKLSRAADGRWMTGDGPLVFFHFSGLPLNQVSLVSKHQTRVRAPEGTPLHQILGEYAQQLQRSPYAPLESFEYSFSRFTDGTVIPLWMRRRFRDMSGPERALVANPFAERGMLERMQELLNVPPPPGSPGNPLPLRYKAVDFLNEQVKRQMPALHTNAKQAASRVSAGLKRILRS
ncbi:hypothetical protein [Hyalangium gracile]|uniref:hypothetical protein n=1 Tax=Hyalangium gracile TaxID=394092 RepID=UPI001CCE56B4|nr:hypothetical protein [Hyalangium gracile]